ncbi:hypothetical protein IGI04_007835 [Brassica rapa subsp. trilocularis]|uniref:Uncharacterized protein n=1 Tax=Brassica rapa subsp. trilocularis TaxID=1813537 RepID=A0ABQ7NMY0_BRACM|nr:hypothetical protein IGI04_007835 [Brassica rapa subsp. trilocularis]
MSSTDSTRSRRIVFSLTDHCDGEFLYPPCRFESWTCSSSARMFRNRLTEGSVYSLSGFDVTRRNPNFRLSDAPSPYDMIGELNAIRSTITDRIPGAQCVILTLRLQSGDNVCVSMFDSMALAFHSKLESCGKESKIVLATSHHHGKKGEEHSGTTEKTKRESLSKPKRHKGAEMFPFLLGRDYSLDVFVDKPEYLSCGEGDFVVNDVIALLPQMKNNSLVSESTKNYERRGVWPSLYSTTFWSLFMVFSSKCIREMHAIHCLFWTEVLLTKPIYVLAGGLFLNATYATHLYFDSETAAGKEVFDRQLARSWSRPESILIKVTADSQIIEFLCTARVTGILMTVGVILAAPGLPYLYLKLIFVITERDLAPMPAFEGAKIPELALPEVIALGIDAKVGKTCNDASTAKRAPSSKEQVAEKSRVE